MCTKPWEVASYCRVETLEAVGVGKEARKRDMAYSRLFLVMTLLFLFCFAVQVSSDVKIDDHHPSHSIQVVKGPNRRLLPFINCGVRCGERCKMHSRPNICLRACGTCCERCKCVPPGTYGNRHMCGRCYTDMLTHGNKPKCP